MALLVSVVMWCFSRKGAVSSVMVPPRIVVLGESPCTTLPMTSSLIPPPSRQTQMVIPQRQVPDDNHYERKYLPKLDNHTTGCPLIVDWPSSAPPTCNLQHEIPMEVGESSLNRLELIDAGATKEAWRIAAEPSAVLKTTTYDHDFVKKYLYKNQKDALIMEATTASPYVLNMYSYCFFSSLVEAAHGTLADWLDEFLPSVSVSEDEYDPKLHPPPEALLLAATSMAKGVRDMHMFTDSGLATFAHADIKASQFLLVSRLGDPGHPILKFNDFNRGCFLSASNGKICPFTISARHKGSTNRAPEEYSHDGRQTDTIDVFSLGSVFYQMLTGETPFHEVSSYKAAIHYIVTGVEPPLPEYLFKTTNPSLRAIVQAMIQSRRFRPEDRPDSRVVADFLHQALENLQLTNQL